MFELRKWIAQDVLSASNDLQCDVQIPECRKLAVPFPGEQTTKRANRLERKWTANPTFSSMPPSVGKARHLGAEGQGIFKRQFDLIVQRPALTVRDLGQSNFALPVAIAWVVP
jgi:hypothetical protein